MGQQEIVDTPAGGSFAPGDLPRRSRSGRVASCLAAAAILLVIGGSVAYLRRYAEPTAEMAATAAPPIPAHTITAVAVERRPLAHRLALIGSVVAWEELPVGTEATGLRVTQVLVDEGDRVDQGQLLARLNDEVLRAQIAQNEAQLERAKASIRMQQAAITEATASLEEAEANLRRASALSKTNVISTETLIQRQTAFATTTAKLASTRAARAVAEADQAIAQAQHAELTARLAQTEIRAPAAGLIAKRSAKLGQVILPGSGAADLFRVVRDSVYELDAEIPEIDLPLIHADQKVGMTLNSEHGQPVEGFIRLVAPIVDAQTRMGIAHVRLPPDAGFRPGQFLSASVDIGTEPALIVPEAALVFKEGKPAVFVVGALRHGVAHVSARPIETGIRRDGVVEVVSGLSENDRVAVSGAGFLQDGDAVGLAPAARLGALEPSR